MARTSPGVPSLNVDVTKFMGENVEIVSALQTELQKDDHLLLKMLVEGRHADIKLTAQGGSVKAHRSVLSVVSPVFKAMFEHDMKEHLSSTVHIPDMTIEGLQLFLLVLYTTDEFTKSICKYDDTPMLPAFSAGIDKHFSELFKALSKYQVCRRRLEPLLTYPLQRNLSFDNCWEFYDFSLQFTEESILGVTSCFSVVSQYIVRNFDEVVRSENFLPEMRRDPDRVHSILIQVGGKLASLSEELSAAKSAQPSARKRAR